MVTDLCQSRVDRRDVLGRDADDAGLIEHLALEIREVERAVPPQRSAETDAELLLVHRQRRAGQGVLAVEGIVAKKAVQRSVQRVGAALRHDVDIAAECAAELGLAAAGHNLKLLDGVDAKGDSAEPRGIVVGRHAVDDEAVGEVALTGDREPLSGNRGGFGKELRAVRIRG